MAKKIMVVIIAAFLLIPFLSGEKTEAAEKGKLEGIDYKRIYTDEKSNFFPATISFGGVNIKGKLKWSGKLEGEQLDECIIDFLDENDININDVKTAQKAYEDYLRIDEVKDGYIEKVIVRLSGIFVDGFDAAVIVDAGSIMLRGSWDFTSKEEWRNTMSMFDDPMDVANLVLKKVSARVSGEDIISLNPVGQALVYAKKIAEVCYAGYLDDLDRWEIRLNGVNATKCLDLFYEELNEYLMDRDPNGKWELNFNGTTTRRFTFMGVRGNKQTWNVYINLIKVQDLSTYHGSPAGVYEGVASMELVHDMSAFSNRIWNLKLGRLKKNWYSLCDTLTINGQKVFKCSESGGISVYRFLCSTDAKVYIFTDRLANAMYLGSSGMINTTMEYGSFDDYQTLSSDRKASAHTATGITNTGSNDVVGYVISDVEYHVEPNGNDSLTIVQDKGYAEVGLLFNQTKVNDGTKEIITFWDKNIWAPLKSKKANITIKAR